MRIRPKKRDCWLNPEKEYVVLALETSPEGMSCRVVSDQSPFPVLFPIQDLDITCGRLPSTWTAVKDDCGIDLQPEAWHHPDFWPDYFDMVPEAIEIYERERDKIMAEEKERTKAEDESPA